MITTSLFEKVISLAGGHEPDGVAILRDHLRLVSLPLGKINYSHAIKKYELFITSILGFNREEQQLLVNAFLFALVRHRGQFYQWKKKTKLPYSYHLCAVACRIASFSPFSPRPILIALWHDLIEDKKAIPSELAVKLAAPPYNLCGKSDSIRRALQLLNRNNYKGKTKMQDYYAGLFSEADVLLVKIADLLANLDACLIRFDEMKHDKTRNWIYSYLYQVDKYLLGNPAFSHFHFSSQAYHCLTQISSSLFAVFQQREWQEYKHFLAEVSHDK